MEKVRVVAAGDSAILILFKQEISEEVNRAISATVQLIKMQQIEGIVDMIPAYASLLVEYNPLVIRYEELYKRLHSIVKWDTQVESLEKRFGRFLSCYGGEFGPDLNFVAENSGYSVEEVIERHSKDAYLIYMLGFSAGLHLPWRLRG